MMNVTTRTAQEIAALVAHLTEIAAVFRVKYGKDYALKPGSPQEAWDLYQDSFDTQATIARLLEIDALEKPFIRFGEWWERRDVIDTGILNELAAEAIRLISCCAAYEAVTPDSEIPLNIRMREEAIAGMLHPAARQLGLDREDAVREAV